MITLLELLSYLNDLLQCDRYQDYAPNGLQIEGVPQIQRVCTAVTASEEVISQAVAWQADALIVHHGYFWKGEDPVITGIKRNRIQKLLTHKINLLAYHLPLDGHTELGNNACLSKLLLANDIKTHTIGKVPNLLWTGNLPEEFSAEQLAVFLQNALGRAPLLIQGNKKKIKRIAWCSGAAQDYIQEAYQLGADAYLSGEVSERTYYEAKELEINYYSCGHHATERYGVQALGTHLEQQFGFDHLFIDSNNPI